MAQPEFIAVSETHQLQILKSRSVWQLLLASMRPHQWVKNLFILAPLLFGKKLGDATAIGQALFACGIFCLISSAFYLINDVLDAEEDRAHPDKRLRPISSGALPAPVALSSAILMLGGGLWLSALGLGPRFLLVAGAYCALTTAYCLALKRIIILDGMTIAAGFVLRVVSGTIAINVPPTHWLVVCAFLLALFLAFTKRRQELLMLSRGAAEHRQVLREYTVGYLDQVNTILIGAAIVCYALYTVAPETVEHFHTNNLIYGTIFVIYGLLRYLVLIRQPSNGANPSKLLVRDKPLLLTVAGWAIFNAAMIYRSSLPWPW